MRYYALRGTEFRYYGYILACALRVRNCSYPYYAKSLGLLSTRDSFAVNAPILSILRLRFVIEHFSVNHYVPLSTNKHIFSGDIYCICSILLSRSQSVTGMAQPRPHAFFSVLTLTPHILSWSPVSSVPDQYSLTDPLFYIFVVMITH